MSTNVKKHLYYMSELKDYKINHHDTDITGWTVKDFENRVIGKVDNLLVNKDLGKVVYIDVEVDRAIIDANHDPYSPHRTHNMQEFINKDGENHIIVPIGLIDINTSDKYVYTDSINYQTFAETKRYKSGTHISRDYENHVLGSYNRDDYKHRDTIRDDNELERTRTAYAEADLTEREVREREIAAENERRENERLRRERELAEERHRKDIPHSSETVEERMERERANLRYKSDDRKTGLNETVNEDIRREEELKREREIRREKEYNRDYDPEVSYDEDRDWEHDNHDPLDDDPYKKRRRVPREKDDVFYNRREFRERDYR